MKIISFNVNGINSTIKKGLLDFIHEEDADIYCFQEIKSDENTIDKSFLELEGYHRYWNTAEKKGYSGVMTLSKSKALSSVHGTGVNEYDKEGRVLTTEYNDFYLVNAYVVNAQRGLTRLDYKLEWNDALLDHLENLKSQKSVVLCGDLNVAHKEIDIENPKSNKKNAGFTQEERDWFTKLLDKGYVDTFREFNTEPKNYTWWSYRYNAREKNIGWRLDYFVVNQDFMDRVNKSEILADVQGSDHCPIRLTLSL